MSIISRFLNVFRPSALERELDDEVRFHLEERAAENLQRGMERPDADSAARQQFGNIAHAKNEMRVLHEVKPKYTAEAMHAKITGTVIMECIVQPNGTCDDVHVTKPLDPGLDREAMNSLQAWRFQPGQRQGKPVPVLVTVDISFTLR